MLESKSGTVMSSSLSDASSIEKIFDPRSLVQLTYVSTRVAHLQDDEIIEMVIKANYANRRDDITGCLWFGPKRFFQVLEGQQTKVDRLYRKIRSDTRHYSVKLISYDTIRIRQFSRWNLTHVAHQEDRVIEQLIMDYTGSVPNSVAEQSITDSRTNLLQRIIERLREVAGRRNDSLAESD